jgi:multimeric flavodoxin WrbA
MKIIGINGSPHRQGDTALLLQTALNAAAGEGAETEILYVAEILENVKTHFCSACANPCPATCYRGTVLEDNLKTLGKADGLLVGSPVYFGEVSAQLKSFWDRTRRLRTEKKLINVVGGALSVGAARFGGQETTLQAIHNMMLVQGMIVVGDGFPENDAGHFGAAAQHVARKDEHGLKRAVILGKRVATVARATAALRTGR